MRAHVSHSIFLFILLTQQFLTQVLLVGALGWQGRSVAGRGRLERLAEAAASDADPG